MGKLEVVRVRNVNPKVIVSCGQFYLETQNIFLMKTVVLTDKSCISKQKLNFQKNDALFFSGRSKEAISTTQATVTEIDHAVGGLHSFGMSYNRRCIRRCGASNYV